MRTARASAMHVWKAHDDACARLINRLPQNAGEAWSFDRIAETVIESLRGMGGAAWIEMDERSGHRDLGPLFSFVRQVRNSQEHGPKLIRAVNQRVTGRTFAP